MTSSSLRWFEKQIDSAANPWPGAFTHQAAIREEKGGKLGQGRVSGSLAKGEAGKEKKAIVNYSYRVTHPPAIPSPSTQSLKNPCTAQNIIPPPASMPNGDSGICPLKEAAFQRIEFHS